MKITRGVNRTISERAKLAVYNFEVTRGKLIVPLEKREGFRRQLCADLTSPVREANDLTSAQLRDLLDKLLNKTHLAQELARYELVIAEHAGELSVPDILNEVLAKDEILLATDAHGVRPSLLAAGMAELSRAVRAKRPHSVAKVRAEIATAIRSSQGYSSAKAQSGAVARAVYEIDIKNRQSITGMVIA